MRIAVYHNLGPGGALRALTEMTRRSSGRHEYTLFETQETRELRARSGMELALDDACVAHHVRELPPARWGRVPLGDLGVLHYLGQLAAFERALAEEIARGGFDVVAVHPCRSRYTPTILRFLSPRSVYFMQEPRRPSFEVRARARRLDEQLDRSGRTSWWRSWWSRTSLRMVEDRMRESDRATMAAFPGTVLCNSYHSAERILAAYGIEASVSYLGVDPVQFAPAPGGVDGAHGAEGMEGVEGVEGARPTVLSVGRIEPMKRYELVVDALAALPGGTRPAFTIVGCEGTGTRYETALRARAASAGVELVLVPDADEATLARHYRTALATLCTAELEPFGLTALESIASGTPVVAIRQGGYRESVVDGVTGVVVDPTPLAVAAGVRRVLDDRHAFVPAALHAAIVDGAWTWDDATARYESHLRAAAARA